ncbi:MAG: VWA domain-containing protein [Phycisphaerae bacterium]
MAESSGKTSAEVPSPAAEAAGAPAGAEAVPHGQPVWFERAFPWLMSGTLHFSFVFVAFFVWFAARNAMRLDDVQQIVIPVSFNDPSFSATPGAPSAGSAGDPSRAAAQAKLVDMMKSDGWAQSEANQNIAGLLSGETAKDEIDIIRRGAGGAAGAGVAGSGEGGGPMSPYGAPGGNGGLPFKSNFYGTGGNATRIVYIIDHSGSMLDNFDYLKKETTRSVGNLVPLQFFSVIMVSDTASVVGEPRLQRATTEAKRAFMTKLEDFVAEGQNDDLLPPFQEAFAKAFAMKPQLIYFLTDGHFSPQLREVVQKLNRGGKVHINTIAFVNHEPSYEDQLKELASKNGGVYHFVSAREAEGGR